MSMPEPIGDLVNLRKLELIKEINSLWRPVYPYLARQIQELYDRRNGTILEMGPFCGVLFALQEERIGESFRMAVFPQGMKDAFQEEIERRKLGNRVSLIETDPFLTGVEENSFDLVIFRGAFFFPSLFQVHFQDIERILKPEGMAFIGGGFGKYTPQNVIKEIGKNSRELNLAIGKVEMSEDRLNKEVAESTVKGTLEVTTDGGLWVVMRK
jgi:SAM-dependent methyltransferase